MQKAPKQTEANRNSEKPKHYKFQLCFFFIKRYELTAVDRRTWMVQPAVTLTKFLN